MASWHTRASWRQLHFQFDHVLFMDKLINALLWTLIWFLASNPNFIQQPTATATKLEVNLTSDFMVTVQVTKKKANFLLYRQHLWWPTSKLHVNLWRVTCKILDKTFRRPHEKSSNEVYHIWHRRIQSVTDSSKSSNEISVQQEWKDTFFSHNFILFYYWETVYLCCLMYKTKTISQDAF